MAFVGRLSWCSRFVGFFFFQTGRAVKGAVTEAGAARRKTLRGCGSQRLCKAVALGPKLCLRVAEPQNPEGVCTVPRPSRNEGEMSRPGLFWGVKNGFSAAASKVVATDWSCVDPYVLDAHTALVHRLYGAAQREQLAPPRHHSDGNSRLACFPPPP